MRLSICMAYYDNPSMLARHLAALEAAPWVLRRDVEYVVCDDGSPRWPAEAQPVDINLAIYRIKIDRRWNQDAARNVCVRHALGKWVLLTDIDHFLRPIELAHLVDRLPHLRAGTVYRFCRETAIDATLTEGTPYKPHPNSWLMTRTMFEKIGGYDERLSGYYGTDADFRDAVRGATASIEFLSSVLLRVPREIIPDASTTTYGRKEPIDEALGKLRASRPAGFRPLRFRFPYEKVRQCYFKNP